MYIFIKLLVNQLFRNIWRATVTLIPKGEITLENTIYRPIFVFWTPFQKRLDEKLGEIGRMADTPYGFRRGSRQSTQLNM